MATHMKFLIVLILALVSTALVQAAAPQEARCVAPAKPGGGFDLTCQLARAALQASGQTKKPMTVAYQPGGIGALAFRQSVTEKSADGTTVVTFSSGSLLNLAQGRFGPHTANDVQWLASLGLDHGVIAVRQDAPFKTLRQLVDQLHASPSSIAFGAGGSIGSQDWMKAALLAKSAGVSHKVMRFVAFEGGGEALTALQGNHVQVLTGDAAEVARQIDKGASIRVLAILSSERLAGRWAKTPTAREQGFDIRWPIIRGIYLGKAVSVREQREWVDALSAAVAHPSFTAELAKVGFQPAWAAGAELDKLIQQQIADYRRMAVEFGLMP
jgi:putative tricarboxylic transport membrane protein